MENDSDKAISKDDLDLMLGEERELQALLSQKQIELAKKRQTLSPHQTEKILFKVEDFARLFKPGGAVYDSFSDIRENLQLLAELDPKAISKLADDKLYSRGPAVKYIVEQLLVSVLNPKSDLWTVLKKVSDTVKIDGNPFTEKGE